jgi:hypothetical protein
MEKGEMASVGLWTHSLTQRRLTTMIRRMEVEGATNFILYAGYTLIATICFALATGARGDLCCALSFSCTFLPFLSSSSFPPRDLLHRLLLLSRGAGTLGFFGCFFFVRKIYSVIKID